MKELGMVHPSIYSGPNNIYECSEDMDEDEIEEMKEQEEKFLAQVGITHNALIRVDDDFQNIALEISIYHQFVFVLLNIQASRAFCFTQFTY